MTAWFTGSVIPLPYITYRLSIDTNSLINMRKGAGLMVRHALLQNKRHTGMEAPIYFIVDILILYSKNVLGL